MMEAEFEKLYQDIEGKQLKPLWTAERNIAPTEPRSKAVPWLWKWNDIYSLAERAAELVTLERGGDRRSLILVNPGLGGLAYATPTLLAAVQWLNGREAAPQHRHTSQAIRFVIDGHGAYTTVSGDKVYMERGDFVINPPWYWHDHGSEVDSRMVWMDGLDSPLTNYLDSSFFEPGGKDAQEVVKVVGGAVKKYGTGQLRPAWEAPSKQYSPFFTFKWRVTEKALNDLAEVDASPFDDVALEYTNPHTGRPVLDTMTAWIQMLRPGKHTHAHRQVSSAVYHVFEGRGATIIDGVRFDWEQGDFIAIPNWKYHEHLNADPNKRAILFSIQDTPVMVALGKYREQALLTNGGHQVVTGAFDAEKTLTPA